MKVKKKKPNPNLPPSRTYLKVWEDKFPWLTKGFGSNGEDRAVCTWCEKYLDVHSSGLRKHQNSSKHILAAKRWAENLQENDGDPLTNAAAAAVETTAEAAAPLVSEKAAISVISVAKSSTKQKEASPKTKDPVPETPERTEDESKEPEFRDVPTVFDIPSVVAPITTTSVLTVDASQNFLQTAEKVGEDVVLTSEDLAASSCGISVSLPVTADILKGVEVLGEGGQPIAIDKVPFVQTEFPVIPMCKLNANLQQSVWYQQQITHSLRTGDQYDVVWQCQGGMFKAHKVVLAAFSDQLKNCLPNDDSVATLYTPDLSADMVKHILNLIYTGQVNITWKLLQDINYAIKLIGFYGKDLTATPISDDMEQDSEQVGLASAHDYDMSDRPVDSMFTWTQRAPVTPGKMSSALLSTSMFANSSLLTPAQLEDQGFIFDESDNFILPDPPEVDVDDYGYIDKRPAPTTGHQKAIKIELEEEVVENKASMPPPLKRMKLVNEEKGEANPDHISVVQSSKQLSERIANKPREPRGFKKDLDVLFNKAVITNDNEVTRLSEEDFKKRIRTDKESQVTYAICRKDRGMLSRNLAYDLFDNPDVATKVKIITVCPICFKCFDDRDKMKDHKIAFHNTDAKGTPTQNSMILGKNKFKCKKCQQTLELKHLVWFVKHYKFCGVDDIRANEVLGVNEIEERIVKVVMEKKNSREMDMLYVLDKPKLKEMSRFLLGKVQETIWGCRKCYLPFDSEETLNIHITSAHNGKVEHGTSYDPQTKVYTCMNCKVYKTNKSVIYFIYHLQRCNVEAQGSIPIDEEEDVDGDTNDDFVDPWGVVFKPLKVISERSKWICESLFGELHPVLYPCHICYSVFKMEDELREHFRITHPGLQNYPEHGTQYNGDQGGFTCPVCKRIVCKKQKSSIYFSYHMQKCSGKTLPVSRTCEDCQKSFTLFSNYQYHKQTKCGTTNFVCHICGTVLKNYSSLRCHVMYAHSEARPYPCQVCNKAFKRAPDLDHHMKLHMGSLDWSCEKCGKAFPVKKALKNHMRIHLSEAEKPHVCHICGNRFACKKFLTNHMTTHSTFRGFACEICNSQVKTRDTLKLHRKKVHKLNTPIPDSCILRPEIDPIKITSIKIKKHDDHVIVEPGEHHLQEGHHEATPHIIATVVPNPISIKEEEGFPILGEELELA